MNKIIFQIGLLAFFVCIVIFASQNYTIIDTVSRSFIVFMGVVLLASLALAMSVLFTTKQGNKSANSMTKPSTHRRFDSGKTHEAATKSAA